MAESKRDILHDDAGKSQDLHKELDFLRSKVNDLSSLIEISIIINTASDLDSLVALVMEKAQTVMKAEASSVMLINEEENVLECTVALGEVGDQVKTIQLKMGEGIAGWVAENGKPLIVPDVLNDPRFSSKSDDSTGFQTRSILAAPLKVKDEVIGVAEVINPIDGKAFDEDDLELFWTFCRQVAMAIDNARMYQMKMEKQKLEQELESAKIIQQSFMPEVFPSSPDGAFSIAARSLPATSVGGDFFDCIQFDDELIGIAVGDVTGKGVPAALYMARFVSDFRINTQIHRDPAKVLSALNKLLVERSRRGMFVTFQYGILNSRTGEFTYCNAGHLPFFLLKVKSGGIKLLKDAKTIPLGIAPEFQLSCEKVMLDPGDSIVLITDGIVEAKNIKGDPYDFDRTEKVLKTKNQTALMIVDSLLSDVQAFTIDAVQHDDLTILALKWRS